MRKMNQYLVISLSLLISPAAFSESKIAESDVGFEPTGISWRVECPRGYRHYKSTRPINALSPRFVRHTAIVITAKVSYKFGPEQEIRTFASPGTAPPSGAGLVGSNSFTMRPNDRRRVDYRIRRNPNPGWRPSHYNLHLFADGDVNYSNDSATVQLGASDFWCELNLNIIRP